MEALSMTMQTDQQTDYDSIYQIVKNAFKTAEQSDGNEQDIIPVCYSWISYLQADDPSRSWTRFYRHGFLQ